MWQKIVAVGLVWSLGAVAAAQSQADLITQPIWIVAPNQGALPYPFSFRDYRAAIELTCRVSDGRLSDCAPSVENPENFVAAARAVAMAATIGELDAQGVRTNGRHISITVQFPPLGIPVAVDPPPAPPNAAVLTSVTWLERPSAADFARYYPPGAARNRTDGRVVLDCIVGADGLLSCAVVSQTPEGHGFGDAALRLSRHFRMAPQTQDGRPTEGGRARVPITFRIAQ